VIEMGKPLVTLPAQLLGGHWSLGYLSNIGLKEDTKKALIANTPDEYVDLVVRLCTDNTHREAVKLTCGNVRQTSSINTRLLLLGKICC
jgi:predicted O-linked N-acetylglucosamine transferase (SPINDLY family)